MTPRLLKQSSKAVIADLAIIGEAAGHIPDDIARLNPDVPWRLMRAMRNRLTHIYFDVDPKVIWDTIEQDLPQLVAPLRKMQQENASG